jgi:hypothetical protein
VRSIGRALRTEDREIICDTRDFGIGRPVTTA